MEIAKEISGEPTTVKEVAGGAQRETIVVIDFGSQYSLLITRRVRECQVYCELVSCDTPWEKIAPLKPRGFILSGGPASAKEPGAPLAPAYVYESHLPVLGICYGMGVITEQLGGQVTVGTKREYGHAILHLSDIDSPLFAGLDNSSSVWMSHADKIEEMPSGFRALAYTENSPIAVMGNTEGIFGLQFHPEVAHTPQG
ncbi:glutamine-hydrolyzing GMP synthase, partial [Chloroflexota bacterium]